MIASSIPDPSLADTYRGLTLSNRADMVDGHYCIMRPTPEDPRYMQYWTDRGWFGHGQVFMSRAAAVRQRRKIVRISD